MTSHQRRLDDTSDDTGSERSIVHERRRNFEKLQDHLASNWRSNGQLPTLRSRVNLHVVIDSLKQQGKAAAPTVAKRAVPPSPVPALRSHLRPADAPVEQRTRTPVLTPAPAPIERKHRANSDTGNQARSVRELAKMWEHC